MVKIFIGALIVFGSWCTVSVDSTPTLVTGLVRGSVVPDTVSVMEFSAFMREKLTTPIMQCMMKNDPMKFHSKCYSDVEVHIASKNIRHYKEKISKFYGIYGEIKLIDCGQQEHICSYRAWFDKDSIIVKESVLRPWMSSSEFVDELCLKINGAE